MRGGDKLVVTRVDRLARSVLDLQTIVRDLLIKRVDLRAIEQPIDTSTPAGKCVLDMLGVFAEFETNLRRERQLEGMAKTKTKLVYKWRAKKIDDAHIKALWGESKSVLDISRELEISRISVYPALKS